MGARLWSDRRWRLLLTALVAFAAAFAGVRLADAWRPAPAEQRLLDRIKPQLDLTPAQVARIAARQRLFEARRAALERAITRGNRDLADAIDAEHGRGRRVRAAVRAVQEDIFRLQDEQIATLLDARTVLTPTQAATFDRLVRRALTAE
ncbi:heavy metal resistance protein [Sphingomonas rubra]|uniref:Heavy-metal resistance n=1 Tax=Sphingomonas rubra TaxID=634430 RepID=A0A1I5SGM4_9SPHN|nr:heavy metal resistance protein [Sphingomonas rubra]SFP69861.1 hypothetical protein SAMN04488241_105218 [Sphingomonas rubra]